MIERWLVQVLGGVEVDCEGVEVEIDMGRWIEGVGKKGIYVGRMTM